MRATHTTPTALPGPRPMPILGARGNFIAFLRNPMEYMSHLYQTYGEIVTLARGTTEYVFVFTPEHNQQLLNNTTVFYNLDASSSPLRMPKNSALARLFTGLTQMNGVRHKQQRQLIMPALQKKCIETYYRDVIAITEHKLASWRVGQRRDLFREMRELTLSIAVKTFVGLDPDQGGDTLCQLLERWIGLVFSPSTLMLPCNFPGFPYGRLLALSQDLEGTIRTLIERKRASGLHHRDVLSVLMQVHDEDGNRLTEDELVGQTNFLFMAGHITTASALTWTLFLLAQHPDMLLDLLDECDDTLHRNVPTMEQLEILPFLEAVIKESMRLLPPVIWWSRISTAPFTLGPHVLPCGTRVIHSAYITHRNTDYYPQPSKFLPMRWLTTDPGPYAYIPFSAGPRMCLGSTFAMMEMKLVLTILLQHYQLTLPPRTRIDFAGPMLLVPKRGMPICIGPPDCAISRSEARGTIRRVVDLN